MDSTQRMLELLAAKVGEQAVQIAQLQAVLEATQLELADARTVTEP